MKDYLEIRNARPEDTGNYTCQIKAWQADSSDDITHELVVISMPTKPDIKLITAKSTEAAFKLRSASAVLPILWCSVFYRAKFGRHEEKILPGRDLRSVSLDDLKCGQKYK